MATKIQRLLAGPAHAQFQCSFLQKLPGEIRHQIYRLVLAEFVGSSPGTQFDRDTCYTRPNYSGIRRSDIRLLRTCRAILRECWFLPYRLREVTRFATWETRRPSRLHFVGAERAHKRVIDERMDQGFDPVIENLQVFAQLVLLEAGGAEVVLREFGNPVSGFLPFSRLTLTIRHHDWWFWEDDKPLRIDGRWIEGLSAVLMPSLQEVCMELETLERKKEQVDAIVQQMCERWYFKRADGVALFADTRPGFHPVSRWRGSSKWDNRRWVRDETEADMLDYYIVTVKFTLAPELEKRGGRVSATAKSDAEAGVFDKARMNLNIPSAKQIMDKTAWIKTWTGPGFGYAEHEYAGISSHYLP
ncbi:hypothetical protein B0I35DRAFT_452081 [Stachybotrys elegans]|uniref:Uncharacterized protein n=1 Tax=Stachybotrys elegans TaxID=80388 RepID=A0A8K0SS42_9HYPO|nr:hypothetical protein B0I35DRAFT_452081 [Stachybotrys elegans]